jgi:acetylornithine deacetylase
MRFAHQAFRSVSSQARRVKLSDTLRSDPDYSTPIPDLRYDGRYNVRAIRKGARGGPTILLNTHLDVVPPSEDMQDPWNPRVEGDVIHGRGSCDAKGQAATIYLVFKALERMGVKLKGNLIAHLVVEEENGGNGTLAMARAGEPADACIVLEPTDGKIFTSIRGAVWFKLTLAGKAGHSGTAGQTRSALLMARDAIAILEKYHADLLASSRGFPLFDVYPNPMPITFGSLQAGNWPASAPSRAVLMGVLGLLPNRTHAQVCSEMRAALEQGRGAAAWENMELSFMYRHDSSVLDPAHPLPSALLKAAGANGVAAEIGGMTASCDAWFYNNQLKIPTLVYGPGTLKVAHSKTEQVSMREIGDAARVLLSFLMDYGGVKS